MISPGLTPAIDRRAISPAARESRWQAADGHSLRRIDWPGVRTAATPRGSLLFLPGRGDHYEKYLESMEEWNRAGWRVTASDWRGQGGSGRLGKDAVTGHVDDFSVWIDDLAVFWKQWTAEGPGPYVLVGHSMGGHLVLRAAVEGRVAPTAMVLSAPMIAPNGPRLPLLVLQFAAQIMTLLGDPARPAWKAGEKPGQSASRRASLLTHDPQRYSDEQWWRAQRPELVMGPASWRWVETAYRSCRVLAARGALERVEVPVLILSTAADQLVSHAANVRAAERLPRGELIAFGSEARHEIIREADPVRIRAVIAIAEFLSRAAPRLGTT